MRAYTFGERLIPEKLGKLDAPEGVVPGGAGEASLVSCYVPDLERDVIRPLREPDTPARRYGLWERLLVSRYGRR